MPKHTLDLDEACPQCGLNHKAERRMGRELADLLHETVKNYFDSHEAELFDPETRHGEAGVVWKSGLGYFTAEEVIVYSSRNEESEAAFAYLEQFTLSFNHRMNDPKFMQEKNNIDLVREHYARPFTDEQKRKML